MPTEDQTSNTSVLLKEELSSNSTLFGISARAWITLLLVVTVMVNQISVVLAVTIYALKNGDFGQVGSLTTIGEPLYSLAVGAVGFYFGQNVKK